MAHLIPHSVVQALAWALVHFVWQGALIGLGAWLLMRVARESATLRYAVGAAGLGAMLIASAITFILLCRTLDAGASSALPAVAWVNSPQADGTIRLPLIGPVQVQGQTALQVRDTIRRELAERRLGSAVEIRVTIRR